MKLQGYDLPPTLLALIEFEKTLGPNVEYTFGFETQPQDDQGLILTYGKEAAKQFIEFARANGTGSSYAFWVKDGNQDLETAPIVFLGDEGFNALAANNIRQLLSLLSCDNEGLAFDEVDGLYFGEDGDDDEYDDEDGMGPSEGVEAFRQWLTTSQNIEVLSKSQATALSREISEGANQPLNDLLSELANQ